MPSELWQRIKAARKAADVSQTDIADQMGCTRAAISLWEQSNASVRTNPNIAQLKKLAELTGAPLKWLVDDESNINDDFKDITEGVFYVPLLTLSELPGYLEKYMATNNNNNVICPSTIGSNAFAIIAHDNMLSPTVEKGDCVYVDPDHDYASGDIVLLYNKAKGSFALRLYSEDAGTEFVSHQSESMPNKTRPMMEEEAIVGTAVFKTTSLL